MQGGRGAERQAVKLIAVPSFRLPAGPPYKFHRNLSNAN